MNYDDIKKAEYDKLHTRLEARPNMPYEYRQKLRKTLRRKKHILVALLNKATTRQERHKLSLEIEDLCKRINNTMPEQYGIEVL